MSAPPETQRGEAHQEAVLSICLFQLSKFKRCFFGCKKSIVKRHEKEAKEKVKAAAVATEKQRLTPLIFAMEAPGFLNDHDCYCVSFF